MVTNSKAASIDFEEYDFEEESDDDDFFSDDIHAYTDVMSDFEDK